LTSTRCLGQWQWCLRF